MVIKQIFWSNGISNPLTMKLQSNKICVGLSLKILKENADILEDEDKFKSLMGNLGLGEFIRPFKIISYLKMNGTIINNNAKLYK